MFRTVGTHRRGALERSLNFALSLLFERRQHLRRGRSEYRSAAFEFPSTANAAGVLAAEFDSRHLCALA